MKGDASSKPVTAGHRNSSRVRLLDGGCREEKPDRRAFLRAMAVQGVSLPAAYFMLGRGLGDRPVPEAQAAGKTGAYRKGAMRHPAGAGEGGSNPGLLVRDFADPYIELLRLLREASEIEHALMIQYLYAAFSVKPAYESLVGFGAPNTNDLLGVAIQEMQHLGQVNRLLVALGAAPNLIRQDFPYEPDIYPFEFNLEPLSRKSVAKYVWAEAPTGAVERGNGRTPADRAFVDQLHEVLGTDTRPNHVGSLYSTVIALVKEVMSVTLPPVPARAASLPPAKYKPLPVGTRIIYDDRTLKVTRTDGFLTVYKTSLRFQERVKSHGVFAVYGDNTYTTHDCFDVVTDINGEDKQKLEAFWPLKVGNKVKIELREEEQSTGGQGYSCASTVSTVWKVSLKVKKTDVIEINGNRYSTFLIEERGVGEHGLSYISRKWYQPDAGLIIKATTNWAGKDGGREGLDSNWRPGDEEEYTLVDVKFPQGTKSHVLAATKALSAPPPAARPLVRKGVRDPDLGPWLDRLEQIKAQGEVDHFEFFKQVFMGTHQGFNGEPDIWRLPPYEEAYPALQLPVNPSAYVGHENQIEHPAALSLAWLGNLNYWTVLILLDCAYRNGKSHYVDLAQCHMMGPILSLARHLPRLGAGMPFDPLSMGSAPGRNEAFSLTVVVHLLGEAEKLEQQLADRLPEDYPLATCPQTLEAIQGESSVRLAQTL